MELYTPKINHFIIQPTIKGKSFCKVFAAKPGKELEKNSGKLFGLIEIKSKNQSALELTNFIIEQIKTNYYYQKNIIANEEEIFDQAIHKTNLALAEFIKLRRLKTISKNLNIIIAIIKNKTLNLTAVGRLNVFLIYYKKRGDYRIVNILEQADSPPSAETMENNNVEIDPEKIFSQTISGHLNSLDFLFLTTPNILNYLSLEQIKNIITTNPTTDVSKKFKTVLGSLGLPELFSALIISLETVKQNLEAPSLLKEFNFTQAATRDSMHNLMDTERSTQKLLSPSLLGGIKKYSEHFKNIASNYTEKIKNFSIHKKTAPTKSDRIKKTAKKIITIILALIYQLKKTFLRLTKNNLTENLKNLIRPAFRWLLGKFKVLPRFSKLALILFIVLAILLAQNVIRSNLKNRQQQSAISLEQLLTEITQKKDAALASLIYQDEKNARLMLTQATEIISNLPKKYVQEPELIKLNLQIEEELNKLRHEINIPEPVMIANFKNLDSQFTPAPLALKINNNFYTQNHNNQTIYQLNLDSKMITVTQLPDAHTGNFIIGTVFGPDELLFLNDNQQLFSFNPKSNKLEPAMLSLAPMAKIIALGVFNNRLYLLDTANNQITRYRKDTANFSQPNQWLNDNTVNLQNAVDFTIDGNIYVLNSNGEIIKLDAGQKTNFAAAIIDPPLQSPTKIKTEENSKYLYILDPPSRRLVVLDKTGQLINQYTSPAFDNLKDFVVLEPEQKIYLMNNSSVFGIPANHLE